MKLQTFSWLCLAIGLVFLGIGLAVPAFAMQNGASVGIVGGADSPTYSFMLFRYADGLLIALALLGLAFFISSLFCLLFPSTVIKHCNAATSAIALGLSAACASGTACCLLLISTLVMTNPSRHPIRYPVSIILGFISLAAIVFLLLLYFKARKKQVSAKGIVVDAATAFLFFPAFIYSLSYIISLMEHIGA